MPSERIQLGLEPVGHPEPLHDPVSATVVEHALRQTVVGMPPWAPMSSDPVAPGVNPLSGARLVTDG